MASGNQENDHSGFLFINKLSGPTSHDIVDRLRKISGIKKIGHAGTLDPFASGLLILAVGREATRRLAHYQKQDKVYIATLKLGAASDTFDRTGAIKEIPGKSASAIDQKQIKEVLNGFIGEQEQVPPMFSAKKIKGRKLYELARAGRTVERKPAKIRINKIILKEYSWPNLTIEVGASTGTYIRALAHDIGKALGCGAYAEELKRTKIGNIALKQALAVGDLNPDNWHKHLIQL